MKTVKKIPLSARSPVGMTKRDEAYVLYRDMGLERTYARLRDAMRDKYGLITTRTFSNWALAHDWRRRLKEHDDLLASQPRAAVADLEADLDQVDALTRTANKALRRILEAAPVLTKPSDVKAMIDSVVAAMNLVQRIQQSQQSVVSDDQARAEMSEIMNLYMGRIRQLHRRIRIMKRIAEAKGIPFDMVEVERLAEMEQEMYDDTDAAVVSSSVDSPKQHETPAPEAL